MSSAGLRFLCRNQAYLRSKFPRAWLMRCCVPGLVTESPYVGGPWLLASRYAELNF
jgi:hypothetical protein